MSHTARQTANAPLLSNLSIPFSSAGREQAVVQGDREGLYHLIHCLQNAANCGRILVAEGRFQIAGANGEGCDVWRTGGSWRRGGGSCREQESQGTEFVD